MSNTTASMTEFMLKTLTKKGFNPHVNTLKFGQGNRKLDSISTLSLPAGHSCPFAKDCRSCTVRKSKTTEGKKSKFGIQDGPFTQFRCYTAIDEALKPVVREARWHNYLLLIATTRKGIEATIKLIEQSLPPKSQWGVPLRIHVAGDFFN